VTDKAKRPKKARLTFTWVKSLLCCVFSESKPTSDDASKEKPVVWRVKKRSVKPKNLIIDTPARVVPYGINATSSCKESIIEISSKPDKNTIAFDKNECVVSSN
jgi:hypothetical protein